MLTAGSSVDQPILSDPWQLSLLQRVVCVHIKANQKRRDPEEELTWWFILGRANSNFLRSQLASSGTERMDDGDSDLS